MKKYKLPGANLKATWRMINRQRRHIVLLHRAMTMLNDYYDGCDHAVNVCDCDVATLVDDIREELQLEPKRWPTIG